MRLTRIFALALLIISLISSGVLPAAHAYADTSTPSTGTVTATIIPKSISITPGFTLPLKIAMSPTTATYQTVQWSSDNPAIVAVSATGVVTSKAVGTATITAVLDGSLTTTRLITVVPPTTSGGTGGGSATTPTYTFAVTLAPRSTSIGVGGIVALAVSTNPAQSPAPTFTWTSSNSAVATVDASGVVSALAAGTATITCSAASGSPATTTITVTPTATTGSGNGLTNHPRLWVTQGDLPRLRSWATTANPMYANATLPTLQQAISTYQTKFFPGGVANSTWPDPGNPFVNGYPTEAYAEFFAYMSLVDPDATARDTYAGYARNLLMYAIHQVAAGMTNPNDQNWGSYNFAVRDRARWTGEAFPLTVDWIYPYLTTQDKADIQKVFLYWANNINTQYQSPIDHGLNGVPDTGPAARNATNNYYTGLFRNLVMMVTSLDATDDPPLDASKSALAWGNTLRSYVPYIQNRWMKQLLTQYSPGGVAAGGAHPEGSYYGLGNMGFFRQAILALQTGGYNDPSVSGPNIAITDMPFWDQYLAGIIASTPYSPVTIPESSYMGQVYQIDNYGDNQRYWLPDFDLIGAFAPMGIYDSLKGNTTRLNATRWVIQNMAPGGAAKLYQHAANIWPNSLASTAILYFMLFDPNAPAPTDPRPSMSTSFFAPGLGRLTDRTAWSQGASLFTFISGPLSQGHQHGYAGMFGLNRNSEWLTEELTQYASDNKGLASEFHNTLSLKNNDLPATELSGEWWAAEINSRGGQWVYSGFNNGDPTLVTSMQPDYDYALTDMTNLYNNPKGAQDILHASRSILWLKPDIIVIYDRATSGQANRFKRFNLWLPSMPTISGHTASALSGSGKQQLNITSLLPAAGALTSSPDTSEPINKIAEADPMHAKLVIEDPSNPQDIRFLTVLQGTDAGVTPTPATAIQSDSGTAFAGSLVGSTVVMFPVNLKASFTSVTYTVPAAATRQLVTGLTPNAKYDVTVQSTVAGVQITVTPGSTYQADTGGVLNFAN